MTIFNAPKIEVSWDEGKTWMLGWQQCGPGLLHRIVHPDGRILWQGIGIIVKTKCSACDGTGQRDGYMFEEIGDHKSPITTK